MHNHAAFSEEELDHLTCHNLWRTRKAMWRQENLISDGSTKMLNFSSNDYLGLARRYCHRGFLDQSDQFEMSSSSSPLVSGYHPVAQRLEQALCEMTGYESALFLSSGYQANIGLPGALCQSSDIFLTDQSIHASLIDGARMAQIPLKRYRHNDLLSLEQRLKKSGPYVVATEHIFSMQGSIAPIEEILDLCHKAGHRLIVDAAHSFGIFPLFWGLHKPDILTFSFAKSLGASGAVILTSHELAQRLIQYLRPYRFSTSLSAFSCAVAYENLIQLSQMDAQRDYLLKLCVYFNEQAKSLGIPIWSSDITPIRSVVVGDASQVILCQSRLKEKGYMVGAIRPPTVPQSKSCLRILLSCLHHKEQIDLLLSELRQIL